MPGSAAHHGGSRLYQVKYRRPFGTDWEDLDLDTAMDMIADRALDARRQGWRNELMPPAVVRYSHI